ncbi:type I restriction endonuclease subunit R [Alloactinosynnema sp. L-07]|uniref:type I restriction endonuclease subunit R n=1 Tax=Alloactinosynnema sp. L-07 TaxID=1653480 RepID=UPI001E2DB3FE|nr:type I restriction endonuclease subunit R [Alloactinosynnema sp. L-07]
MSEDEWETIALEALSELDWEPLRGPDIAPGAPNGRESWQDLVLPARLQAKMRELNPLVPPEYLDQARAEILAPRSQDPVAENYRLHAILVNGYQGVTYVDGDGIEQNPTIRLVSPREPDNEFLAVRQVTVRTREVERRFDVVLYVNGLPMAIMELKKASAKAGIAAAHAQLATYLREFPMAFRFALLTVISDGILARYGTPFTPFNHFSPWNIDDDGKPVELREPEGDDHLHTPLEYLIEGVFNRQRFLQLQRNYTAFDQDEGGYTKRIAKPHQYFAVSKALECTVQAVESHGKAGVVWHTQGSGKSMEMELYAHRVGKEPKLRNPTIIVVTDRKELDDQLFNGFQRSLLLPETPEKIITRADLRAKLSERNTGGILFTTLQKFSLTKQEKEAGRDHPLLSDRRNIIVVVDEAHRSHYDDLNGYARHLKDALPHATLIAFTGTPVSLAERNTREVFGDYIDIYDLTRAVNDEATVRVYFEPRLIEVTSTISDEDLDQAADEATLGLDESERARIEKSVAVINAVYGAPERLRTLAADIVAHWESRRDEMVKYLEMPGRAFIVCGTREICAKLYKEIIALRPDWHDEAIDKGKIKVVYSGDRTDEPPVSDHVRREGLNKSIQARIRKETGDDPLELVIVKDMMLTGFDAPPLHTLYLDRPLKGALLMQTLARVNRTFRGKPNGLLVAYAPLAENLSAALAEYTDTDQVNKPVGRDTDEEVAIVNALITRLDKLSEGYHWRKKLDGGPRSYVNAAIGLTNHLRSPDTPGNKAAEGEKPLRESFREYASQLGRAWSLCSKKDAVEHLRAPAKFYEQVLIYMGKFDAAQRQAEGKPVPEEIQRLLSALVASATATGEVIDIYAAAGMPKPSLTDIGPEYLAKAQAATHPHLAIEALRALLTEESAKVSRHNLVRQRAFSERIAELMRRYTNQQLTSAEVIAELVALAKEIADERDRGKKFDPPLSEDELAFYDAVSDNESAVTVQGEDVLAKIARELLAVMRRDVKTDWTVRDDVRAKLRSSIKRLLVRYRYPPDKQPAAIKLVIEQMEAMAPRYAA